MAVNFCIRSVLHLCRTRFGSDIDRCEQCEENLLFFKTPFMPRIKYAASYIQKSQHRPCVRWMGSRDACVVGWGTGCALAA